MCCFCWSKSGSAGSTTLHFGFLPFAQSLFCYYCSCSCCWCSSTRDLLHFLPFCTKNTKILSVEKVFCQRKELVVVEVAAWLCVRTTTIRDQRVHRWVPLPKISAIFCKFPTYRYHRQKINVHRSQLLNCFNAKFPFAQNNFICHTDKIFPRRKY